MLNRDLIISRSALTHAEQILKAVQVGLQKESSTTSEDLAYVNSALRKCSLAKRRIDSLLASIPVQTTSTVTLH